MENETFLYWRIWGNTCEGNHRWYLARTTDDWDEYMVRDKAESYATGGCGDDFYEITEIESASEDNVYTDFCE